MVSNKIEHVTSLPFVSWFHDNQIFSVIEEDIYEDAEEDYGEYGEEEGAGDAPYILPPGKICTYFKLLQILKYILCINSAFKYGHIN